MRAVRLVVIALASAVLASATPAQNDALRTIDELAKAIEQETKANSPDRAALSNLGNYLGQIRGAIVRDDLAEAERGLLGIRPTLLAAVPKMAESLDQVLVAVRAQNAAKEASLERAIETISADIRSKIASHAPAKDFDSFFSALNGLAVSRNNYGYNESSPAAKIEALRNFVSRWQDYLTQTSLGNADQAAQALNELTTLSARVPVVPRSDLLAIQADIAKLRDTRGAATNERIAALTKRVQTAIANAKNAAELDDLLVELSKPRSNQEYRNYDQPGPEQLRQFVTRWQDYLSKRDANNTSAAQDVLRGLLNDTGFQVIYPRSKLLALSAAATTNQSGSSVLDIEKLPTQLTRANIDEFIKVLPTTGELEYSEFRTALNDLSNARRLLLTGSASQVWTNLNMSYPRNIPDRYARDFAIIKRNLQIEAAIQILQPDPKLSPNETETPATYLNRLLGDARDRSDWQTGLNILSLIASSEFRTDAAQRDYSAYRLLVMATKFEAAEQFAQAVQSYLASLKAAGPNVPAKTVGDRLKNIETNHPKEFEAGKQMTDSALSASPIMIDPRARIVPPPGMLRTQ
ncbi:MAG: hypothetical protein QM790_00655 [Nibricoccus sp.]